MLVRQGDARDSGLDRHLAYTLAAVAGGLNAAAYHAVGFFSANMTGNVSALSSLIALGDWGKGLGYLGIVLTFIFGAFVSTLVVGAGLRRGISTIYARVILGEAAMLVLLGFIEGRLDRASGVPILIFGISFLMGLQNAIVTHISDARVRTTHVSGMSTDIGIGFAKMLDIGKGSDPAERLRVITKLHLHGGTVGSFLGGGVLGVLIYRFCGAISFALAGLPLALAATLSIVASRRSRIPADRMC